MASNDLRWLQAAVPQLKDYLLSNEIFWNIGIDPQLTLGNLLLAETQVKAAGGDRRLLTEIAAQKKEWPSAWQKKAEREFGSRLRQWTQYLAELSEHPSRYAAQYKTEVRVRTLLELLAGEAPGLSSQLAALDSKLKEMTTSGDFVWGKESEKAFPKGKYWFLWVGVKQ
ncbi:MAG: hypothetical protein M1347_05680 [Chloroflexi bacterium]|nr:hypothetical protein [Chloroflexota bacterium]